MMFDAYVDHWRETLADFKRLFPLFGDLICFCVSDDSKINNNPEEFIAELDQNVLKCTLLFIISVLQTEFD